MVNGECAPFRIAGVGFVTLIMGVELILKVEGATLPRTIPVGALPLAKLPSLTRCSSEVALAMPAFPEIAACEIESILIVYC